MARVEFVSYQSKLILIEDFSNLNPGPELMDTITTAQQLIATQPPKSVLALLDATNAHFDAEVLAAMKKFVVANTPFIKAAAVVGVTGLLHIALNSLAAVSGREFKTFPDRTAAMEYLVSK